MVFGSRDYAMRVWLDPDRLQSLGMTAGDVTLALQGQNVQVASGMLNQPPVDQPRAFQIAVQTLGRLSDPEQFANIVVKQTGECGGAAEGCGAGRACRAGLFVELLPRSRPRGRARGVPAPGLERAATAQAIRATMAELSKRFPPGRQVHDRLRPDPVHPAVGRRGDARPSSRRSCWSCWWSCCSCRPGAPPSSRWSPFRCR